MSKNKKKVSLPPEGKRILIKKAPQEYVPLLDPHLDRYAVLYLELRGGKIVKIPARHYGETIIAYGESARNVYVHKNDYRVREKTAITE